jgi:hypothetical protein
LLAVGAPQLERGSSGAVGGVFAYDAQALLAGEGDDVSLLGDTRGLPREALFDDGMLGWSLAMARGPEGVLLMAGAPRAERVDGRVLILALPSAQDDGPGTTTLDLRAVLVGEPESDKGRFGWSVAAGDVDGDGRVDALVGANGISARTGGKEGLENGRAYLLLDAVAIRP